MEKYNKLVVFLSDFKDHLTTPSEKVLTRISKVCGNIDPTSNKAEMLYMNLLVTRTYELLLTINTNDGFTYAHINKLLESLEECNNKLIPFEQSPIYMLGRIGQQIKMCVVNLEEDCLDISTRKNYLTNDALAACTDSFEIGVGLTHKLGEILEEL